MVRLRASWPSYIAEFFEAIHFVSQCSQIRVRAIDFGIVARMDRQFPATMLCVLLYLFLDTSKRKRIRVIKPGCYAGREETTAKSLVLEDFEGLVSEAQFNKRVEDVVIKLLNK